DLRPVLPAIRVPTLILCDRTPWMENFARYLSEHIAGAEFVMLPVEQGVSSQQGLDAVQHFVTGTHPPPSLENARDGALRRHREIDRPGGGSRRRGLAIPPGPLRQSCKTATRPI